jgi:hypothetical protein
VRPTCPANLTLLDFITLKIHDEVQNYEPSHYAVFPHLTIIPTLLGPNILLENLFSDQSVFFAWDEKPTYIKTGKLYFCICPSLSFKVDGNKITYFELNIHKQEHDMKYESPEKVYLYLFTFPVILTTSITGRH